MVTTTRRISIEELEKHGGPEGRWELINGELIEMPPDSELHGEVGGTFHIQLGTFVLSQRLGRLFLSETCYVLSEDPPTVRKPDISFIRTGRLPANRDRDGFIRTAPDLVAEVISPSDRMADVLTKIGMWLDFGVPMVLLIAPRARTVTVYRPDREPRTLSGDQTLEGEDVVPGFSLSVRAIFAPD
jgi:Uma2 family endonuclease